MWLYIIWRTLYREYTYQSDGVCGRMLDALAGRTEPSNVKGTILVNGKRLPSDFKFMTGYVVQVM